MKITINTRAFKVLMQTKFLDLLEDDLGLFSGLMWLLLMPIVMVFSILGLLLKIEVQW